MTITTEVDQKVLFQLAWARWGNSQFVMAMEECAELSKVCSKFYRMSPDHSPNDEIVKLSEEIADVQIMLDQLTYIMGASFDKEFERKVACFKAEKLARLGAMLSEGINEPKEAIYERIKPILAEKLIIKEEEITGLDINFVEDFNVDSLDMVDILMSMEEEFKIELQDKEFEAAKTVGELVDLVYAKINPQPGKPILIASNDV